MAFWETDEEKRKRLASRPKKSVVGSLRELANKPVPKVVQKVAASKPVQAVSKLGSKAEKWLTPLAEKTTGRTIGQALDALMIAGMNDQEKAVYKPIFLKGANTKEQLKDVVRGTATTGLTALAGTPQGIGALGSLTILDAATSVPFELGTDIGLSAVNRKPQLTNTIRSLKGVGNRIPENIPRAGLYGPISNPLGDKVASALKVGRVGKALTTGAFNVGEDYLTYAAGMTNKPTAGSNAGAIAVPFLMDRITGKEVVKSLEDMGGEEGAVNFGAKVGGKGGFERSMQRKTNKYKIVKQEGIVEVEGTPVEIAKGLDTFIHEGTGGWVVSEASSGQYMADGKTKSEAITKAKEAVKNIGIKKVKEIVASKPITKTAQKKIKPTESGVLESRVSPKSYEKSIVEEKRKINAMSIPELAGKTVTNYGREGAMNPVQSIEYNKAGTAELNRALSGGDLLSEASPTDLTLEAENERGFITTLKESPNTVADLKNEIEGSYKIKTNDATIKKAQNSVTKDYLGAYNRALDTTTDFTPESVAEAHILVGDLSRSGNIKAAASVAEAVAIKGTRAGQTVQAFSIWNKLTPEGMLVYGQKAIADANSNMGIFDRGKAVLSPEDSKEILRLMTEAQGVPEAERGAYAKQALEIINKAIPPSASELFDKYRYESMLSNPRTQMRNIWGNTLQTWISKPMTMAFETPFDWMKSTLTGQERTRYITDVPKYYKDAINAIPMGAEAFTSSLRGETPIDNPDLGQLRRTARAGPVSRFMEGMDRFNQTIIGSAIKNDLMSKGASETRARVEADKAAQYWLFRTRADPSNKSGQGGLLSAIDKLSSWVASLPGRKWFVPFIQTPTNIAKQWIEFSPAGLATIPGNSNPMEQLSKASIGSVVMLMAAKMASEGNLTWAAPTDPQDKAIYYETRKPFSIKIGGRWVPMQYMGPLAAMFALPAAYEYYDTVEKNALSSTQAEKAYNTLQQSFQFMTNQTFLTGLNNYIQILSGDPDYNFESSAGFTATQVIPYSGFLRYISQIIDPTMRKNTKFMDSFYQTVPGLSENSYPYMNPVGEEIKREPINYVLPYDIKTPSEDPAYETLYQNNVLLDQVGVFQNYQSKVRSIMRDPTISMQEKMDRVAREKSKIDLATKNLNERNQ